VLQADPWTSSHGTGHAVLDDLKPGWLSFSGPPQTEALHEASATSARSFSRCRSSIRSLPGLRRLVDSAQQH